MILRHQSLKGFLLGIIRMYCLLVGICVLSSHPAKAGLPCFELRTNHAIAASSSEKVYDLVMVAVDPFSSGQLIPAAAISLGSKSSKRVFFVGIDTGQSNPSLARPKEGVDLMLKVDPTSAKDLRQLKERILTLASQAKQIAVLPGSEPGANLYHSLNLHLSDAGYRVQTHERSVDFRDKSSYGAVLRANGFNRIREKTFTSVRAALAWAEREGVFSEEGSAGLALKPLAAASGYGVFQVKSREELREKFAEVMGSFDRFGNKVETILLQDWVDGPEYAVDLVRFVNPSTGAVESILTDLWMYGKTMHRGSPQYNDDSILDPAAPGNEKLIADLFEFAARAANVVGHRVGWVHAEVKVSKKFGLVLLDFGDRLPGSMIPRLAEKVTDVSSVELGLLAFIDPAKLVGYPKTYKLKKKGVLVNLFSSIPAPFRIAADATDLLLQVQKLPGVSFAQIRPPGETIFSDSHDLSDRIGFFEVVHTDPVVIRKTIQAIRAMKWTEPPRVAVVDIFSSAVGYIEEFFKRGFEIVHLRSGGIPENVATPDSNQAAKAIVSTIHLENMTESQAVKAVASQKPLALLPGSETGVTDALRLAEKVSSKRNPLLKNGLSPHFRDKALVSKILREAGLAAAPEYVFRSQANADWAEFIKWATDMGYLDANQSLISPLVLKPSESSMGEDVQRIDHLDQILPALGRILGKRNVSGVTNKEVIIQKFLEGPEYVVDLVQFQDPLTGLVETIVSDVWLYRKQARMSDLGTQLNIYDHDISMNPVDPQLQPLIQYALSAVKAMKVKHGPVHFEIIWTKDLGPVLIDFGGRLAGSGVPRIVAQITDYNPVSLSADSYLSHVDPRALPRLKGTPKIVPLKRKAILVSLFAENGHEFVSSNLYELIAEVKKLPSVHKVTSYVQAGQAIASQSKLNDQLLQIELVSVDLSEAALKQLEDDFKKVRYQTPWTESSIQRNLRSIAASAVHRPLIIGGAYSTGFTMAKLAKDLGFSVQVVKTRSWGEAYEAGLDLSMFDRRWILPIEEQGSLQSLVQDLAKQSPIAIIAGAEKEVLSTHLLQNGVNAQGLRIPSNPDSLAYRHKNELYKRLESSGIRTIPWGIFTTLEEATSWCKKNRVFEVTSPNGVPRLVVKPSDGSSGTDVSFVRDQAELNTILRRFQESRGSAPFLLQKFVHAPEYAVNIVVSTNRQGKLTAVLSDIWKYSKVIKPGYGSNYDYEFLLDPNTPLGQKLFEFVAGAADALMVRYGAIHAEVFDSGEGPVLVDFAVRGMGQNQPSLVEKATGRSQNDLTLLAYLDPEAFAKLDTNYKIFSNATFVNLMAPASGMRVNPDIRKHLEIIRKLPSYYSIHLGQQPGQAVPEAFDLSDSYAHVLLLHPSAEQVAKDREIIRRQIPWLVKN